MRTSLPVLEEPEQIENTHLKREDEKYLAHQRQHSRAIIKRLYQHFTTSLSLSLSSTTPRRLDLLGDEVCRAIPANVFDGVKCVCYGWRSLRTSVSRAALSANELSESGTRLTVPSIDTLVAESKAARSRVPNKM